MLGDIGSMIRFNEMVQPLRSNPPENKLILIIKKPLPKENGTSVYTVPMTRIRIATTKRKMCFLLKYSTVASESHNLLQEPPG